MSQAKHLPLAEVAGYLIEKIDPMPQARIRFEGFELPDEFGATTELGYGDLEKTRALGLSMAATEMAKNFVKNALEDIFSEESDLEEEDFCVTQEDSTTFLVTPKQAE